MLELNKALLDLGFRHRDKTGGRFIERPLGGDQEPKHLMADATTGHASAISTASQYS